jgi:acetolactate synthase small subunit
VHHTHHLEMTVADTPLVLDRIVTLCRARQCTIVALRYEAADRHRPGQVLATLRADARRARVVIQRLAALPGVLAVGLSGSGGRAELHARAVTHGVVAGPSRS